MQLADAFIQSDLQCIRAIHFFISMCVPWELNPQPFALLTQCSTTEPQEHLLAYLLVLFNSSFYYLCFCPVTVILLHSGSFHHENNFLICVNIPGNKVHSDSDSAGGCQTALHWIGGLGVNCQYLL